MSRCAFTQVLAIAKLIYTVLMSLDGCILVDVSHLFMAPIIVGGNRAFPSDCRVEVTLQDKRRFRNGTVYLHTVHPRAESLDFSA